MIRRFAAAAGLLVVVVLSGACAASTSGSSATSRNASITTEQVFSSGASNAYDVVQALRPAWLRKRGEQSINIPNEIQVYYNNIRLGGVDSLRQIAASDIASIDFFDARAATFRWGSGHTQGVILVRTR